MGIVFEAEHLEATMLPLLNRIVAPCVVTLVTIALYCGLAFGSDTMPGPEPAPTSTSALTLDAATKIERGIQLRRERRDREALELFREAFEVEASSRVRTQIALAEQAIGDWVNAEQDLVAALQDTSVWVETHRAALNANLAAIREHLGTLLVTSNVRNAQLAINGRIVGQISEMPLRVPMGEISVRLDASGYEPAVHITFIDHGAVVREAFTLTPLPSAKNSRSVAPRAATSVPPAPPGLPVPISAVRKAHTLRTVAWSMVVGAGLLLTGAIVSQVTSENRVSEYNDDRRCVYGELSREQRCGGLRHQIHIGRTLALLGYEAAIGSGVIASVLLERASSMTIVGRTYGLGVGLKGTW